MPNRLTWLLGAGMGAAAMYYLDPARGRYRRGLVRDRLVHTGHQAKHGLGVVGRDMRNRALGTTAAVRSLADAKPADDTIVAERVRACLGRVVTHPASIEVETRDGIVTLSGPILEDEVPLLVDCVLGVRGVLDVRNELEVHAEPGRVPGLQGNPRRRPGHRSAFMQANWSPTARAAGGLAGAAVALYGFSHRMPIGPLLGTAGLLVLGRAASNLELRRLLGVGGSPYTIDVRKALHINAPVDKVFALWSSFENFPMFMTHVRSVRRLDDAGGDAQRWRWTVHGPTGIPIEFDAVMTAREENRLLAWTTEGNALVQHAGRVQFRDNGDGTTTVDVKMAYNPVAGAVGHAVARLLGADPKHQMDDDLLRMKTYLETGKPPHDAAVRASGIEHRPEREARESRSSGNGAGVEGEPPAQSPPPG